MAPGAVCAVPEGWTPRGNSPGTSTRRSLSPKRPPPCGSYTTDTGWKHDGFTWSEAHCQGLAAFVTCDHPHNVHRVVTAQTASSVRTHGPGTGDPGHVHTPHGPHRHGARSAMSGRLRPPVTHPQPREEPRAPKINTTITGHRLPSFFFLPLIANYGPFADADTAWQNESR